MSLRSCSSIRVTDATHGRMPCAAQALTQKAPHRAFVVAHKLAPFAMCGNVPRRPQPTACDGEAWSCSSCAQGPGCAFHLFKDGDDIGMLKCARRRRPAECRRGGTRRSRSRRRRDDDSRQRAQTTIAREPQTRASASSRHATSTSRHFLRLGIRLIPATRCSGGGAQNG